MKLQPSLTRSMARLLALALLPASVAGITAVTASASKSAVATIGCQLSGPVKHVIYMVFDGQATTPAPWVPYTRAGCNFGGVSTANIELENTGTGAFGDMTQVFGAGSPEWTEANTPATKAQAQTDFVGIAIHCAQGGGICAANSTNVTNSRDDKLPDESGGYVG